MRLITGDECGLLKEVLPELGRKKKDPNALIQPHSVMIDVTREGVSRIDPKELQTRDRGLIDMVWVDEGDDSTNDEAYCSSFGVLRKNGSVELWTANIEKKQPFAQHTLKYSTSDNIFGTKDCPRPLGLGFLTQHNRLCAGDMMGNIAVLDCNKNKCNVIQTYNSYTSNKCGNTISYTPGKLENVQLATALAFDTVHARAAVGGREREVCLTDISTGKLVFKTKNMPPDPQTLLQQPVWPTAIQFLDKESNLMAVGTAYKQVRLYDVRENSKTRRPTSLTPEGLLEYRITSLCQTDENEIVVGDASGDVHAIDLRRLGRNSKGMANRDLARFAGPAGSIRQLKKHPTLPRLAVVGLDRMLRIYDTKSRKQLDCVYLKQRLNCVLFHKNYNWDPSDTGVVSDEDYENINDVDIDQDDIVEDYVDSDDSSNESNDNAESEFSDHVESDSEGNKSDDKLLDDNDDSSASHDTEDDSLDENNSEDAIDENSEDNESESNLFSQASKRRRRK